MTVNDAHVNALAACDLRKFQAQPVKDVEMNGSVIVFTQEVTEKSCVFRCAELARKLKNTNAYGGELLGEDAFLNAVSHNIGIRCVFGRMRTYEDIRYKSFNSTRAPSLKVVQHSAFAHIISRVYILYFQQYNIKVVKSQV